MREPLSGLAALAHLAVLRAYAEAHPPTSYDDPYCGAEPDDYDDRFTIGAGRQFWDGTSGGRR